jgi:hypothetical protein
MSWLQDATVVRCRRARGGVRAEKAGIGRRREPPNPSLGVTLTTAATILQAMNLPPNQPPPPEKPKLSAEERRVRQADRLTTIRLRMAIGRELEDRGITTPAAIGEALGMPAADATKLLTHRQWREGDVARLQAAAARLGLQVPSARGDDN